jgi:CRAL/TRIO domain
MTIIISISGLHYINASPAMTTVFNLMKSMFSEKMRSRFFVHKSLEELYDAIPNIKKYLPTEYGGDAGPEAAMIKEFHEAILGFREPFMEDIKYGVDEKKRQTKSKVLECFEGVEGTFRQLTVD